MDCHRFKVIIGEYYDQRLPEKQRLIFESHLLSCGECRKTLQDWAEISALAKSIPMTKAPEHFEAALQRRIMEARRKPVGWTALVQWLTVPQGRMAAWVVALMVLIGSLFFLQRDNKPEPRLAGQASHTIDNHAPEPVALEAPDYVNVLLKGNGNEQVIMRLPSTIRVYMPDNDDSYYRNVSH